MPLSGDRGVRSTMKSRNSSLAPVPHGRPPSAPLGEFLAGGSLIDG